MIRVEVLIEDRSGLPVMDRIMQQLIDARPNPARYTFSLHPHRGKGYLPRDIKKRPARFAGGLLNLLPAKVRAYDRHQPRQRILLVVVMDADEVDPDQVYQTLEFCIRQGQLPFVIGVSIEEMEAWLLGDAQAVFQAYPQADRKMFKRYQQDAICGTWEMLARVVSSEIAERLIKVGYPAVGQYKYNWARAIAPFMDIRRNASPSLAAFVKRFHRISDRMEAGTLG